MLYVGNSALLLRVKALFKSLNSKLILIASVATLIVLACTALDILSIEVLLLTWNAGLVIAIILWEREKRTAALNARTSFSDDERWVKAKINLEQVDSKLEKTKDDQKRHYLLKQRQWLQNELRRLEWSIKESNMNSMYNAQAGNLRRTNKSDLSNAPSGLDRLDTLPDGTSAVKKRASLEMENKDRMNLQRILDEAEAVIKSEPRESLTTALRPLANDCKAHYNAIKKRKGDSDYLTDYWVAWSIISSIASGLEIDTTALKYASKGFQTKLAKFARSVSISSQPSTQVIPPLSDHQNDES
ncbi:MAG: hypothetical protein ACYCQJ_07540 [Nitrososphaerales archaeon]